MQARKGITKLSGKDSSKIQQIVDIMEHLEEGHKEKGWILREAIKRGIKIPKTANTFEILDLCPKTFVSTLHQSLVGGNTREFGGSTSLTKTYFWLFTDIVGASNPTIPTKDQARKIIALNEIMARTETFRNRDPSSSIILPVGDGVAVGFSDYPEKPIRFALEIHRALYRYNQSKGEKD